MLRTKILHTDKRTMPKEVKSYTNINTRYQQLNLERAKKTPLHHENDKAVISRLTL